HPGAHTSATVRATFVIDPEGVIRAIIWYPMNVGRNVDELLRLVTALQTSDKSDVFTREGWRPGDPVLVPPPLVARNGKGTATAGQTDWYFRLEPANGGDEAEKAAGRAARPSRRDLGNPQAPRQPAAAADCLPSLRGRVCGERN